MSALGLAAVDYARRGWRVFPCHSPANGGCSCGAGDCASPAKHPRTRHGLHDSSAEEDVVARWWRRWPGANVGLRTGDGLVVLDVDPAHGGAEALAALEADHGAFPATATVATGSGGLHLYLHHDGHLRNSAGALGPGLDVRADGGYVIAPPSWHMAGAPYRWTSTVPLAPLPDWVLDRLTRPAPRPVVPAPSMPAGASAWAAAALAGEVDRVVTAAEGQRNHTLNRSAFALGQIVGGGYLDAGEVADLLERAGEAAGLGAREAAATVASGLAAGTRWPRHPRSRPAPGAHVGHPARLATAEATDAALSGRPAKVVSLDAYVAECAGRLFGPEGDDARRWLGVERGLPDEVLAVNRVGADPGGRQARPVGVVADGPAVVIPAVEDGRVTAVLLQPLAATGRTKGPHPGVVLLQPVTVRGPCVVVTDDVVDALSACAGGYRAAIAMPGAGLGSDGPVHHLVRLGAPLVLAVGGGAGPTDGLSAGLVSAGARVARLRPPGPGGLNQHMLRSADWPGDLAAAVRYAWACAHRPRRLVR